MRYLIIILAICAFIGCESGTETQFSESRKAALADSVKQEFLHAWNGYKEYAWGHDALRPLTKSYRDWYDESLLMTPVDAFDTMVLMGLDEEAEEAKQLIFEKLSFDKDFYVQNFEVNIRLLGGLITAYQLDGDQRFLDLAVDLADRLLPAFDSETGMPYVRVHLQTGEKQWVQNNPAEIGTIMLEFGTLSKLTGNNTYYDIAKKATVALYNKRSELDLIGTVINVETGEWDDTTTHISGRIDSYYEYLYKAWILFGDEDFKEMWETSIAAVNKHLADETDTGFWYGYAEMEVGEVVSTNYGALDAFMAGLLALSGDLERAKKLQESNFKMWQLHEIEPEGINYSTMEINYGAYVLRPENIESAFYLYRLTGEEKYLEQGRIMFQSLVTYCRNDVGYAALSDVVTKEKSDDMESFFLAETLKYAYLLFAPESTLDLDEAVFNTEAHPFYRSW